MPKPEPETPLVIRCPNWIGDMIAATAALRCMRANYPKAHIALLLKAYVRPDWRENAAVLREMGLA